MELSQPQGKIGRLRSPFTRETKIEIAKCDSQAYLINRRCGDDLGEIVRKPLKVTKYLLILRVSQSVLFGCLLETDARKPSKELLQRFHRLMLLGLITQYVGLLARAQGVLIV